MDNATAAIVIKNLVVHRDRRKVLHEVSFTVSRGKIVGLLGPSGGGKSTLMRSIVGSQIIAGGTVTVFGKPAGAPSLRKRIGYVTQAPSVYSDLTVRENIMYFAALFGSPRAEVDRVIDYVDMKKQARSLAGNLSGGQRSRVSLAAALVGKPDLLVLDEPTVGLDPVLRNCLWNLFQDFSNNGTTLLISSHVMDEATRCARLLFIREGVLIADGSLDEITSRTHTENAESAFLALAQQEAS